MEILKDLFLKTDFVLKNICECLKYYIKSIVPIMLLVLPVPFASFLTISINQPALKLA